MSCKNTQDCGEGKICSKGECVSERRETFTSAWNLYQGELKAESAVVEDYADMLEKDLDDAADRRKKESESQQEAGTGGSIFGAFVGFLVGGPLCAAAGAGTGYIAGSGLTDLLGDAESYGLTQEEFDRLQSTDLKYLKGTHEDVRDEAERLQANLEEYDKNEWKQHVFGGLNAAWNTYKLTSFGVKAWDVFRETFDKEVVEDVVEDTITETIDITDPETLLDWDLSQGGPGWSSAQHGGTIYDQLGK